jgi:hypothetical protein
MIFYDDDEDEESDGEGEDEEEDDDEEYKGYLFGNKTVEERDKSAAASMKLMKEKYGHIYRSKVRSLVL